MDTVLTSIEELDFDNAIKKELTQIYRQFDATGITLQLKDRVEDSLEKMFKSPYGYMIPMSFINSEIGRLLFGIKLETNSISMEFYGVNETTVIVQKTRALVVKDFAAEIHAKARKIGGHYYITEENLRKYMITSGRKPFSEEEARERIRYFKELREKTEDLDEIKRSFDRRFVKKK